MRLSKYRTPSGLNTKTYKTTIAIKNTVKTIKIFRNWVDLFQERDSISRKANHKRFRKLVKWYSIVFIHGYSWWWLLVEHILENWMYMFYIGQCLYRKRLSKTNIKVFFSPKENKRMKWTFKHGIHTVDKHTSDVYYVNILVNFPKINRNFEKNRGQS